MKRCICFCGHSSQTCKSVTHYLFIITINQWHIYYGTHIKQLILINSIKKLLDIIVRVIFKMYIIGETCSKFQNNVNNMNYLVCVDYAECIIVFQFIYLYCIIINKIVIIIQCILQTH